MPLSEERMRQIRERIEGLCALWGATFELHPSDPNYQKAVNPDEDASLTTDPGVDVHLIFRAGISTDEQQISQQLRSIPEVSNVFLVIRERE